MAKLTRNSDFYLVVSAKGWNALTGRLATKVPSLKAGEVVMKLSLNLPGSLFERPQLQASITIPEDSVSAPVIDAKTLDNVREVLAQQTGMDITVRLVESDSAHSGQ